MTKKNNEDEPAMVRVRKIWEILQRRGWTNQQLGEAMGYPTKSARNSVSQFLKSHDPTISRLRRFAKAADLTLSQVVGE